MKERESTESGIELLIPGREITTPQEQELIARLRDCAGWQADDDEDARFAARLIKDFAQRRDANWVIAQAEQFRLWHKEQVQARERGKKSAKVHSNLQRTFRNWLAREIRFEETPAQRPVPAKKPPLPTKHAPARQASLPQSPLRPESEPLARETRPRVSPEEAARIRARIEAEMREKREKERAQGDYSYLRVRGGRPL